MGFTVQDSPQAPAGSPTTPGQAAPAPGTQLTLHGIVRKDHAGRYGHYLLTDVATKVTYELQGPGLDEMVGAQVEVIGSIFDEPAAAGASSVVSVSDIHQMPLSELPGATTATAPATTPPPTSVPTPAGDPRLLQVLQRQRSRPVLKRHLLRMRALPPRFHPCKRIVRLRRSYSSWPWRLEL